MEWNPQIRCVLYTRKHLRDLLHISFHVHLHTHPMHMLSPALSLSLALGLNSYLYVLFFSEIQQIRSLLSESSDI